jgi:hypothetical protein
MKLISFETKPTVFGIKSPTVWIETEKGGIAPLCYLRKPKWVSNKYFDEFINSLNISVTDKFLRMSSGCGEEES